MSNAFKIIHQFVSGKYTTEQKARFWGWLVDPSNQKEKEEALSDVWHECDFEMDEDLSKSYEDFRKRVSKKSRWFGLPASKWVRVAATLLIPILSIVVSYLYIDFKSSEVELVECIVPEGQQKKVHLPDGSEIILNAGTVLVYPSVFSGETRSVYLSGEGYFDITPDQKHPFIVKTQYVKVRVLGTKFNLKAYSQQQKTITTLQSGSVVIQKVDGNNDLAILSPNEQLEYDNQSGLCYERKINASLYSGWTKGELNFISQSLSEIVHTLEQRYAITIHISSDLSMADLYTIKFVHPTNVDEVLNIVARTVGGIIIKQEDEKTFLISPLKERKGGK